MSYRQARIRRDNERPIARDGDYVLYWAQAFRRVSHNHALDYAIHCARELNKPVVFYEGLRFDYPWASDRLHRFVLEGMLWNRAAAKEANLVYWPFVATPAAPGRGLLRRLAERACLVVTDDYPCFLIPEQTAALARKIDRALYAVDGNSVVPLSLLGPAVSAAAHLRPRIHKAFADAWTNRAASHPHFSPAPADIESPFDLWDGDIDAALAAVPIDRSVRPLAGTPGGTGAARERLRRFVKDKLPRYADSRSIPAAPGDCAASGLSPYLHFGHLSIEEVIASVFEKAYGAAEIALGPRGKREGFYGPDPNVNAYLDEAITWRDVGFQWHKSRRADTASLERALPAWALTTLQKHAGDPRAHLYTAEEWEAAATHDPLWNAAQIELMETGVIHNYLRMLWGKKVLEWSKSPEEGYRTLVHLNNKYAIDGRDPNSYTGILWCFGLFDRPWAPERPVYGVVRYMSSDNTAKKFKLRGYLDYVAGLRRRAPAPSLAGPLVASPERPKKKPLDKRRSES